MRIFLLVLFLAWQSASTGSGGKLPPLTLKEVSLMLRSGYSSAAVQREIVARRFIDAIDAAAEKSLVQAGAAPELISDLKRGEYALPPEDIAAAKNDLAARERLRTEQGEAARRQEAAYQRQLAQTAANQQGTTKTSGSPLIASIRGNLVTSKNGVLQTFNNQALENKKLIGLYFSARWCPQCRKFTPQLVEYYNRIAAAHPEFEIIFISSDRSVPAMEEYMRDTQMPWPAVAYEALAENEALRRYAGPGIPCLVVVDASGKVISDSYNGKTYLGPNKVLADLDRIFGGQVNRVAREP